MEITRWATVCVLAVVAGWTFGRLVTVASLAVEAYRERTRAMLAIAQGQMFRR